MSDKTQGKPPNVCHPIQPVVTARNLSGDIYRFKANAVVDYLLEWATKHGCSMNDLARVNFDKDDRQHFLQLIGYTLSGYSDISYASDEVHEAALMMVDGATGEDKARIACLERELALCKEKLSALQDLFRVPVA